MSDTSKRARSHHRLPTNAVLPLFDTNFGVALTLLAYSVPDHLMSGMDAVKLGQTVSIYLLTGVAVILYWYKLRRLIHMTRLLLPMQLLLGMASLLLIVMMPKFAQLVVLQGGGFGDLTNWTPSQIVNTIFIFFLGLFDGICLAYGRSLVRHPFIRLKDSRSLQLRLKIQSIGFVLMIGLGLLVLASTQFNNEYIFLVPIILLAEEYWLGVRLSQIEEA